MNEKNVGDCKVGIALPNTPEHKKNIKKIEATLKQLAIEVFWVDTNKAVTVNGNWKNS